VSKVPKNNPLAEINLGPLDADQDNNLLDYFVEFGDFSKVTGKSRFLIVGHKGTGKSAIRRFLAESRHADRAPTIEIEDTYSLALSRIPSGSIAQLKNHLKAVLVAVIIQALLETPYIHGNRKRRLKALDKHIPWIKKVLESTKIKVTLAEIALQHLFHNQGKLDLVRTVSDDTLNRISHTLGDQDLWVFIDDVDAIFATGDEQESLRILASLIYAASDINKSLLPSCVFIVLLMRSEVFERLSKMATDLDKHMQYIWHLAWKKDELIEFLASRIRWTLDLPKSTKPWRCWSRIFSPTKKTDILELQAYLIDRVINGPRDLLLLVEKSREAAIHSGRESITWEDIEQSEYEYGKEKLAQITRNFQGIYPNIGMILGHLFRGERIAYSRQDLEAHIRNRLLTDPIDLGARNERWYTRFTPYRFIETLYTIGFLGFIHPTTGRLTYVLEEANPESTLVTSSEFRIHKAFAKFLELSDN